MAKRMNQNLSEGQDGDVFERIRADVRGHAANYYSVQRLSEDSGCSPQTIHNLLGGASKPTLETITKLMVAMGLGDQLLAAFSSDNPIWTAEAQKNAPPRIKKLLKEREQAKRARAQRKKGR